MNREGCTSLQKVNRPDGDLTGKYHHHTPEFNFIRDNIIGRSRSAGSLFLESPVTLRRLTHNHLIARERL